MPRSAHCLANSAPSPLEAPVIKAHGPYLVEKEVAMVYFSSAGA